MNKRIQQLAEQAKEVSHWLDGGYTPVYRTNLEKFAELIVRECASQIRFTDLLKCNDDSDGEILLQASAQLKQHFGVKE